ncbi:hypothetical protein COOONC_04016 [Cooperia oncophora]
MTSFKEVASTTSLPDPSASITDSFPRVFKEFDFLEAEHDSRVRDGGAVASAQAVDDASRMRLEEDEACSLTKTNADAGLEDEDFQDSEGAQGNSEGGGASTSRLSRTSASSDRTPCPSEVDEEENEAEEGFVHESPPTGPMPMQDRISPSSAVSRDVLEKRLEAGQRSYFMSIVPEFRPNDRLNGVDATWNLNVAELQDDSEGELTAYATLLFTQLFRSCCGRVASLLRDAMHIFSSRPLARTFAHAQDVLTGVADCPFLFVTAQYLRCSGILPRLKLSLFELREHWETFNERKEQNIREMELGKLLSKLFFQLMLMSDSLNDMVRLVNESHGAQAVIFQSLCQHVRSAFGAEFGCCEASDIDVLLLMFCRSHSLKAWALVGAVPDALRRQSQNLRDANADVASAVRRLASDSVVSHRTSTASSLTESFQKISYLPD